MHKLKLCEMVVLEKALTGKTQPDEELQDC